jgi:hypothetical protein
MDKHSLIVVIASIVILETIGYSIWNIYATGELQLGVDGETFRYNKAMTNENKFSMCNPLPLPVSFNQFHITVFFEGKVQAVFNIDGTTIQPKSSIVLDSEFITEEYEESQYLLMHFDHTFEGNTIRIDPKKMTVGTQFQTPILGIIPFSTTNQYTSFDFWNMLNEKENLEC